MDKRPLSLTIIAGVIILFSLLGIYGLVTAGTNPTMTKMLDQMHMSVAMYQAWAALGIVINFACAYGILKGLPWSRVLYLGWGIIGVGVGMVISPMKAAVVLSLVFLVVICAFLWTSAANDWFSARGFMLKRERAR